MYIMLAVFYSPFLKLIFLIPPHYNATCKHLY